MAEVLGGQYVSFVVPEDFFFHRVALGVFVYYRIRA